MDFTYSSEDMGDVINDAFAKAECFLLGRRTYEIFAASWPNFPDKDDPVASKLNRLPKYVVSATLQDADWQPSTIIRRDLPPTWPSSRRVRRGDSGPRQRSPGPDAAERTPHRWCASGAAAGGEQAPGRGRSAGVYQPAGTPAYGEFQIGEGFGLPDSEVSRFRALQVGAPRRSVGGAPFRALRRRLPSSAMDGAPTLHWRGINHLALVTNDMDATVRFYHGVLGAELVATIGTANFRHYFFSFGEQCTVAFFEYASAKVESFAKPAGVPDARAIQFDHLSFNVPDEEALLALRARLKRSGSEVTDVVDHGFIRSVYFTDPNGIALEASWWTLDATGRDADYGDDRLFGDPNPVPAVAEIRERAELSHMPQTRLV